VRRVAITGGTGAFGRQFVRLALEREAERIVVISRGEVEQARLEEDFDHPAQLRCFLGDVRDVQRLTVAFENCDVVVHAAALKRVQSGVYNTPEMIATNCVGTQNVMTAAREAGVKRVLLLSSDKAVMPASLYGASKLMAEHITIGANVIGHARGWPARSSATATSSTRAGRSGRPGKAPVAAKASRSRYRLPDVPVLAHRALRHRAGRPGVEIMRGGEIFVPVLAAPRSTCWPAAAVGARQSHRNRLAHQRGHLVEYLLAPRVARTRHLDDEMPFFVVPQRGTRGPLRHPGLGCPGSTPRPSAEASTVHRCR
jgi:UDP-N-acetylglucosamine 4,6-dehydratase